MEAKMFRQFICLWVLIFSSELLVIAGQSSPVLKDAAADVNETQVLRRDDAFGDHLELNGCINSTCHSNITTTVKQLKSTKSYHFFSDFKTFFLPAMHWCIRYGMRLATIESAQENAIFLEAFRKHNRPNDDYYWIAGRRLAITGNFDWFPSGRRINYFNFDAGQPNNWAPDFCLVVTSYGMTGRWHDTTCESNRYFVCES